MEFKAVSTLQSQSEVLEFARDACTQAQAAECQSDLMTAVLLYEDSYDAFRSVGAAHEATAVMKNVVRLMYAAYAED